MTLGAALTLCWRTRLNTRMEERVVKAWVPCGLASPEVKADVQRETHSCGCAEGVPTLQDDETIVGLGQMSSAMWRAMEQARATKSVRLPVC